MRILPIAFLLLVSSGCGVLYRHEVVSARFRLYGNHDPEHLEETGKFIARVFEAYHGLFPRRSSDVPTARIVYEEEELSRERIFTSDIRQEGYYLPLLKLIHLSPQHGEEHDHDRETVILHEVAHHFLVSLFPGTRTRYWLNEGFACALEVSFFDEAGRLVVPLYHATLHQHARQALHELGAQQFRKELAELVDGSWFRFHRHGNKTRHYAMAWALTYYIFESLPGSLEDRLETVLAFEPQQFKAYVDKLPSFVAERPDRFLDRIARQAPARMWALDRWQELPNPNGSLLLQHLQPVLEQGRAEDREVALGFLARLMSQRMLRVSGSQMRSLRATLARSLTKGTATEQRAIAQQLHAKGRHAIYLRPLVDLLESPSGEVRAEAAAALSRLASKPTITRPAFWKDGSESARRAEVDEWRRYLSRQGL